VIDPPNRSSGTPRKARRWVTERIAELATEIRELRLEQRAVSREAWKARLEYREFLADTRSQFKDLRRHLGEISALAARGDVCAAKVKERMETIVRLIQPWSERVDSRLNVIEAERARESGPPDETPVTPKDEGVGM
jgi:chromosome segregation ATPase